MQHFNQNFEQLKDVEVEQFDKDEVISEIKAINDKLVNANDAKEAIKTIREYFDFSDDFHTVLSLINYRYTLNTTDEKYTKLQDYVDENVPFIEEALNDLEKNIYNCKYRNELEKEFGKLYFDMIALSLKTFSSEIVSDLVEENKLQSAYVNLLSSGLIEFDGKEYSIPQMGQFTTSSDRDTRIKASKKVYDFYAANDEKIGEIYDSMVHVRDKIAKKLGYENFVQLGYDRMGRLDWNKDDAKIYRQKILENIVPISTRIYNDQKQRLGYGSDTRFSDYNIFYKSGNATPKGNADDLISAAKEMYSKLDSTASKYFNFMVEHGCMDILAKPHKSGGGYMDYLPSLKTSLIFSNFDGTSGDVDVLTHEFGHALQGFLGANETDVPAYRCPGMECAEMHSMSMEYLTYPWMDLFFKEDADKYRYEHLCSALTFIPYGCIVDQFQTYCYENPSLTHQERKAYWRNIELQFLPHREYIDNEFLRNGGFWERQSHIFTSPLYYLDYTIAQVVSLEFFIDSLKDHKATFEKYLAFDKLGGKYPFKELLKKAGIKNPMEGDTLKDVACEIVKYLDTFNPNELDK